jgi:HEAT repeat protein
MTIPPDEWPDYDEDPVGHCEAALRYGDRSARFTAADILRGLADDAEGAIPLIVEKMRTDESEQVRAQCAFALIEIGEAVGDRAEIAVPGLIETLQLDPFAEARSLAASALRAIGEVAKVAVPVLKLALKDKDESVRKSARKALRELDR